MINILSYVGMNMQAELCLWTILGLLRTIFDATLFKVNANLKQVWQMKMPAGLSMPVQRVLRTMISGIMLVQCFTVYVYLASYIVLLYPVFLEERPALVLPWLLLAAIRRLLCELTSFAVGLGTCVLLGTAKPPCIKFIIFKISSIMPAFYMWMLVYSYYHVLKLASAFKTFPVLLPPDEPDDGFELAVRRRRTKSLFSEEDLRKKLVSGFYPPTCSTTPHSKLDTTVSPVHPKYSDSSIDEGQINKDGLQPLSVVSNRNTTDAHNVGTYDDWFGREVVIPRGDRVLEQFVTMLLRIGIYLNRNEAESIKSHMFNSYIFTLWAPFENNEAISADDADTPPLVGNSRAHTASYLREYPQIFMKRLSSETRQPDDNVGQAQKTGGILSSIKDLLRSESHKISQSENEQKINYRTLSTSLDHKTENEQNTTSPSENSNKFVLGVISDCIEAIFDDIISIKKKGTQQNSSVHIVSSEKISLPTREGIRQRRVNSENSSKEDNDANTEASKSESEKNLHEQEGENSEGAIDNLTDDSQELNSESITRNEDDDTFSFKKVKKE